MVNIDWDKAEAVFFSSTPYPLTFAHYTDKYGGWCISPYYNTYLGRFGECLNKLNDDSKINYWKDSKAAGDEGSVVEFTDLKTAYANLVESYKERINEDNCVGGYSQEVFDASGLASATTPEEYAEAFTYLNEHTTRLADDGLYRIKCAPPTRKLQFEFRRRCRSPRRRNCQHDKRLANLENHADNGRQIRSHLAGERPWRG